MEKFKWWIIKQKTHLQMLEIFREESKRRPWCLYFLRDPEYSPGNLNSKCRLGFVPFDHCIQDRYFLIDHSGRTEKLVAGGISTQIYWDSEPASLPPGWQGVVKQSYMDQKNNVNPPNTQVALLAFTSQKYRGMGISGEVISQICKQGQERGYMNCVLPVLPPTQFNKEHVYDSMREISAKKRPDGQLFDYWTRLHERKGAQIIGHCDHSHRFAFNLNDFNRFVSSDRFESTGEHLVRLDKDRTLGGGNKNMWQVVYADVERDFAVFNWGCIWVQYDLEKLAFSLTYPIANAR